MGVSATRPEALNRVTVVTDEGFARRHPARRLLDVMLIATVPASEMLAKPGGGKRWVPLPAEHSRPVSGTLAVDVGKKSDRILLQRILRNQEVLSVTSPDGWTQRIRLAAIRDVSVETDDHGGTSIVATYTWLAAEASN